MRGANVRAQPREVRCCARIVVGRRASSARPPPGPTRTVRRSCSRWGGSSPRSRPSWQVRRAAGLARGLPGSAVQNAVGCPVWLPRCASTPAHALPSALTNPAGCELAETARRPAGCSPHPRVAAATRRPPGRQKGEAKVDIFRIVAWAPPRGLSPPFIFRSCHLCGHLPSSLHIFAHRLAPTPPCPVPLFHTAHARVSLASAAARRRPPGDRKPGCRSPEREKAGVSSSRRAG